MANRLRGNVYIIDATGTLADMNLHVQSIAFYSTDTTGELQLSFASNTTDVIVHIRNNQSQPFTLPLFIGGHTFADQLVVNRCVAGTGFIYLR